MITCLSFYFRTGLLYNILEHIYVSMRRFEDVCTQKANEIHFQYEPDKNDIFFHAEVYLPISVHGEFNIWAPEFAHIHSLIYLVSKDMDRTCINWSNNFCFTIDFTKSFLICIWSFQIKLNPISSKIDFIYLIHLKSA